MFLVPIVGLEAEEFRVQKASLHMESHRYVVERIFIQRLIIIPHVDEQSLFIAQVIIILQLIIQFRRTRQLTLMTRLRLRLPLVLQQGLKSVVNSFSASLSPHEVHFFHLLLIMFLPPVPPIHQTSQRQPIVPLTHIEFIQGPILRFNSLSARDNPPHRNLFLRRQVDLCALAAFLHQSSLSLFVQLLIEDVGS